jgi:hypothetical protein
VNASSITPGQHPVTAHVRAAVESGVAEITGTAFRVIEVFVHDIKRSIANATPAHALVGPGPRQGVELLYRADDAQASLTSWVTLDRQGELLPTDHGYALADDREYAEYEEHQAGRVLRAIDAASQPQLSLLAGPSTGLEVD